MDSPRSPGNDRETATRPVTHAGTEETEDTRPEEPAKVCAQCGTKHGASQWRSLPEIEQIRHENVRHLLQKWPWPPDVVLVVRRCLCGSPIAKHETRSLRGRPGPRGPG